MIDRVQRAQDEQREVSKGLRHASRVPGTCFFNIFIIFITFLLVVFSCHIATTYPTPSRRRMGPDMRLASWLGRFPFFFFFSFCIVLTIKLCVDSMIQPHLRIQRPPSPPYHITTTGGPNRWGLEMQTRLHHRLSTQRRQPVSRHVKHVSKPSKFFFFLLNNTLTKISYE